MMTMYDVCLVPVVTDNVVVDCWFSFVGRLCRISNDFSELAPQASR